MKSKDEKQKKKMYISYNARLAIYTVFFIVTFAGCLIAAKYSFEYTDLKEIDYSETERVDYKVYLKENEFYEQEYLDKNMLYIASLIKNIDIDLGYNFEANEKIDMGYKYKVVGDLVIKDEYGKNTYFTKEYLLKEEENKSINNKEAFQVNENIIIDYDYYNKLANDFKTQYGLNTTSYLEVKLEIEKESDKDKVNINDDSEVAITIPLSERAIQINFNSKDTSLINKAIIDRKMEFNSIVFIIEIILLIISIIIIKRIIELIVILPRKKEYDKYLDNILKEYDRLIVKTTTWINEKESHIIEIHEFEELLDVRDTLKLPIMYYVVNNEKSYFYIKNGKDVYLLKLKAIDINKTNGDINAKI